MLQNDLNCFFSPEIPVVHSKSNVTITEGTPIDLICVTRGDYFPEVIWRRGEIQINIEASSEVDKTFSVSSQIASASWLRVCLIFYLKMK